MKFKGITWMQGASTLITIPKHVTEYLGIKINQEVEIDISTPLTVVCLCGNIYSNKASSDHFCDYTVFKDSDSAIQCARLLNMAKAKYPKTK